MQLKDTNIEKLVERRPRSREFERIWNASTTLNPREDFDRLRRLVHYRLCLRTAQALLAPSGPFGDSFCSSFFPLVVFTSVGLERDHGHEKTLIARRSSMAQYLLPLDREQAPDQRRCQDRPFVPTPA